MNGTERTNIERFNMLVGQIQERLIESCPLAVRCGAEDFGLRRGEWTGSDYLLSEDEIFLNSTLNWLSSEGYIRVNQGECVITSKWLDMSNQLPNRLRP